MYMVYRGRDVGSDFEFGQEDFNKWLEAIGLIPEGIEKPTVGRFDHTKGYVWDIENNKWNFRWQEHSENSSGGGFETTRLGKSGMQTGAAWKASIASPNNSRNTRRSGWHTGAAAKASVESTYHISKQIYQCQGPCGRSFRGPKGKYHVTNQLCRNWKEYKTYPHIRGI
jgi:hypothetical protein